MSGAVMAAGSIPALLSVAVGLGALAQSLSGIGFVMVSGPVLVMALGPGEGIKLALMLAVAVNLAALVRDWRMVSLREVGPLLAAAVVATPLCALVLRTLPTQACEALAGAAALSGAIALGVGVRWERATGPVGAVGAGTLSAAMNVAGGMSGPAVALFSANAGWCAHTSRANLQIYSLVANLVAVASLGLPAQEPSLALALALATLFGLVVGVVVSGRVSARLTRNATLLFAGGGGLLLLARALLG